MERTEDALYTREDVARRFGRTTRWVDDLIARGELGSYKVRGSRFISESHITEMLKRAECAS